MYRRNTPRVYVRPPSRVLERRRDWLAERLNGADGVLICIKCDGPVIKLRNNYVCLNCQNKRPRKRSKLKCELACLQ